MGHFEMVLPMAPLQRERPFDASQEFLSRSRDRSFASQIQFHHPTTPKSTKRSTTGDLGIFDLVAMVFSSAVVGGLASAGRIRPVAVRQKRPLSGGQIFGANSQKNISSNIGLLGDFNASATSIPGYPTVLSFVVFPINNCTARRFLVRR